MAKQKTGPQVYVSPNATGERYAELNNLPADNKLTFTNETWRKKLIAMRRDPTIALARLLSLAPFYVASWTTEADADAPEGAEEFIGEELQRHRLHLIEHMIHGTIDWGWQAFEKVYKLKEVNGYKRAYVSWYKPLTQYNSLILVDPHTGSFEGIRQTDTFTGQDVDLFRNELLFHAINVEGTNWYGEAIMLAAHEAWAHWSQVEYGANRYDQKIAGSHWVVYYPPGQSLYGGVETDNLEIAKIVLAKLEASGSVVVPNDVQKFVSGLEDLGNKSRSWDIQLLTDGGSGSVAYLERQKYFDILKVRAFGFPERAILEGQHGTKAEAGEHGDLALTMAEMRHQQCIEQINLQDVNALLRINWGPEAENTVRIKVESISEDNRALLRTIYDRVLADPEIGPDEIRQLDLAGIRDQLRLPTDPDAPEVINKQQHNLLYSRVFN